MGHGLGQLIGDKLEKLLQIHFTFERNTAMRTTGIASLG